jgi:hypothetical protein
MTTAENPMQKIITQCWEDEAFKIRLMAHPNAVLEAECIDIPENIMIRVVEDTAHIRHMVIPPKTGLIGDEDLLQVVGGKSPYGKCHPGTET